MQASNHDISQIQVTFPDGNIKLYEQNVTILEIAESISKSLAKKALIGKANGQLVDLSYQLSEDAEIAIITDKDAEALEVIRHDAAHMMAEAVKELYPETQVTIGPAIEDGFYYDFARSKAFTPDDLDKIEKKMHEISKRNEEIIREEWDRDEAVKFFKSIGEDYKAEIIASIPTNEKISLYKQGEFIDLCRGPHAPSTAKIKHFKLMKLAGAYWRGDSNNEMLQRIYGTAWATEKDLKDYLHRLEEAQKRDHRKLGKELDLFHLQEEAPGMIFWHDKGWTIYRILENYIRSKLRKADYIEVKTPTLVDRSLWEKSGHWDKFQENMFISESEEKIMALKPMNCPCHVEIFKQGIKSYRDLPLRMAEFGSCHRNEPSGALHGLMRVRGFVQDDAHIFCTEEQITSETIAFCDLLKEVYKDFGFTEIKIKFSDRPEKRAGSDEIWDLAESSLKEAIEASKLPYELNPGEGAFYGPKLEFVLTDAIGRDWQCGTIQLDFVLPERLGSNYISATGEKKRPVMLHRAIFGSFERFIGILIEEYAGRFPLWLAPIQVGIVTVTNEVDGYAKEVYEQLKEQNIRVDIDLSAEKIGYKIRNYSNLKYPIIIALGKNEQADKTICIRRLGSKEQQVMDLDNLIKEIKQEMQKYNLA